LRSRLEEQSQSMIPKSGNRFSEKIMLQEARQMKGRHAP
jgi:hypothetical protein